MEGAGSNEQVSALTHIGSTPPKLNKTRCYTYFKTSSRQTAKGHVRGGKEGIWLCKLWIETYSYILKRCFDPDN